MPSAQVSFVLGERRKRTDLAPPDLTTVNVNSLPTYVPVFSRNLHLPFFFVLGCLHFFAAPGVGGRSLADTECEHE